MIQTNRLTELIKIKVLSTSGSSYGEVIETYKPVLDVWATVLTEKGQMSFNAPGNVYNNTISFYMRYLPIVERKKYRVEHDGQDYEIEEITHVSRRAATIIRVRGVK
jgi:SPP1 family predicted phage head-tail adaptor